MPNKTEQELRDYLKKLSYNKRTRVVEYMELRDIVAARHNTEDPMICDNCGHKCHMFAEFGRCGRCACTSCYCNRCDLEYGMGAK